MVRKALPLLLALAASIAWNVGCGTTKSRLATEQLLMSDAVDHAVSEIDFSSLASKKVYFDSKYIANVKGAGFVNSEYVISSLRQQMVAADVRIQEKPDEAEIVVEARIGTLGTDGNEIVYGIPANRGISEAASLLPNVPTIPAIPELSLARKESQTGAVKIAAYAYDKRSGEPIWQSGMSRARTSSQDVWLFGAGPFQQGSIHNRTTFAGNEIRLLGAKHKEQLAHGPAVPLEEEFDFRKEPKREKSRNPVDSDGAALVDAGKGRSEASSHPDTPGELSSSKSAPVTAPTSGVAPAAFVEPEGGARPITATPPASGAKDASPPADAAAKPE